MLILGVILGVVFSRHTHQEQSDQRLNSYQYTYINPLLDHEISNSSPLLNREVVSLKNAIEDATEDAIEQGMVNKASVYYRDLNNGPWFSTGEENQFKAASLFKIPVMIAIYKQAESDPSLLEKQVPYTKEFENIVQQHIDGNDKTIQLGQTYTVQQLIESMIINSDNIASYLLLEQIDPALVTQVFNDLALESPDSKVKSTITPQKYSTFLRVLYNATYLNKEYSEKALELLSHTTFSYGIRAVLPPETKASVKFGIAVNELNEKQLHECGIIYWDRHRPHIICIMTTGNDYLTMANFIKNTTSLVQEAVYEKVQTN